MNEQPSRPDTSVLTGEMQFHPVADLFPLMPSPGPLDDLAYDIAQHGLREPLWTYEGKIIDGRNRTRALAIVKANPAMLISEGEFDRSVDVYNEIRAGGTSHAVPEQLFCEHDGELIDYATYVRLRTEPRYRQWDGKGSPVTFIVSLNLHRRHLSESQRGTVAARLVTTRLGDNQHRPDQNGEGSQICGPMSQTEAAALLNVSARLVSSAKKVLDNGIPELVAMVDSGEMTVSKAETYASLSGKKQKTMISRAHRSTPQLLKKFKLRSLKAATSKTPGFSISPDFNFSDSDELSRLLQTLQFAAAEYAKTHGTTNYSHCFTDVIEEIEQEKLSALTLSLADKILAYIDRGTEAHEAGIAEHGDLLRFLGVGKEEFEQAIAYLLECGKIEAGKAGGKHDNARGGRKTLYMRVKASATAPRRQTDDDGDECEMCGRGLMELATKSEDGKLFCSASCLQRYEN